jgi:hypothetical protein
MIICKGLNPQNQIRSLEEWREKCPPEKPVIQWVQGRSAKELASFWLKHCGVQNSITALLDSYHDTTGVILVNGSPEFETKFDKYGKGRQHDFLAIGKRKNENVLVSIEAKVDETFGNETLESYFLKAKLKQLNGINTKVTNRIEDLIKAIFTKPFSNSITSLRYQLIHAIAGTLAEAKIQKANKAVFIIQKFLTDNVDSKKVEDNDNEINKLVKVLSNSQISKINHNELYGPFLVPGNLFIPSDIPLYIGKVITDNRIKI